MVRNTPLHTIRAHCTRPAVSREKTELLTAASDRPSFTAIAGYPVHRIFLAQAPVLRHPPRAAARIQGVSTTSFLSKTRPSETPEGALGQTIRAIFLRSFLNSHGTSPALHGRATGYRCCPRIQTVRLDAGNAQDANTAS